MLRELLRSGLFYVPRYFFNSSLIFSIVSIVNFAIYVLRTKFAYIYSISFLEIISTAIDFFTCFCQYMIMLLAKRILWYNIILNIIMKIRNLSSKSQRTRLQYGDWVGVADDAHHIYTYAFYWRERTFHVSCSILI